jgi:hypothetical protein
MSYKIGRCLDGHEKENNKLCEAYSTSTAEKGNTSLDGSQA